jgi:hypothetical protein
MSTYTLMNEKIGSFESNPLSMKTMKGQTTTEASKKDEQKNQGFNFKTMALLKKQENLLSEFETNLQRTITSLTGGKSILASLNPSPGGSGHKSPSQNSFRNSREKSSSISVGIKIMEEPANHSVKKPHSPFLDRQMACIPSEEVSETSMDELDRDRSHQKITQKSMDESFKKQQEKLDCSLEENKQLKGKIDRLENIIKDYELKISRAERTFNEVALKERQYIEEIRHLESSQQDYQREKINFEQKIEDLEGILKKREEEFMQYGEELIRDFQAKVFY